MIDPQKHLERIWDNLLSREPEKIIKAFLSLDKQSQGEVKEHLARVINEPGWHPEQVLSAKAVLIALGSAGTKE